MVNITEPQSNDPHNQSNTLQSPDSPTMARCNYCEKFGHYTYSVRTGRDGRAMSGILGRHSAPTLGQRRSRLEWDVITRACGVPDLVAVWHLGWTRVISNFLGPGMELLITRDSYTNARCMQKLGNLRGWPPKPVMAGDCCDAL